MKRSLVALSLALLISLVVGASVANATHSNGKGPKQDKANGTGKVVDVATNTAQQIHVNAKSGPAGENPRGWIWEKTTTATDTINYKAKVLCLTVTDNKAVIGGEIVKSKSGETGFVEVYVEDNEEPGTADKVESELLGTTPPDCLTTLTGKTITRGNYIVHDATTV